MYFLLLRFWFLIFIQRFKGIVQLLGCDSKDLLWNYGCCFAPRLGFCDFFLDSLGS